MKKYTVSKETLEKRVKTGLIISIIPPLFILLFLIPAIKNDNSIELSAIIPVVIVVMIIYCGAMFLGIKMGNKALLKTSLTLEKEHFILEKLGTGRIPKIEQTKMAYEDIRTIKRTNSGIVVKGTKAFSQLLIPKLIDNCDEIYHHLEQRTIGNETKAREI